MSPRKRLLVVFHTQSGNTAQLAEAVLRGANRVAETETRVLRAFDAGIDELLNCDGLLLGTPKNFGYMSGALKDFFDRTYYAVLGHVDARPYATLVCAGSDGQGAARQIARIATGWRLKPVAEPLIVITHAQTPEAILAPKTIDAPSLARARELGTAMAAGISMGIW